MAPCPVEERWLRGLCDESFELLRVALLLRGELRELMMINRCCLQGLIQYLRIGLYSNQWTKGLVQGNSNIAGGATEAAWLYGLLRKLNRHRRPFSVQYSSKAEQRLRQYN